jgi:hypothetical protein
MVMENISPVCPDGNSLQDRPDRSAYRLERISNDIATDLYSQ